MKIDIHFHVIGNGRRLDGVDSDVYFYPDDNNLWFTRLLYDSVEKDLRRMDADLNKNGQVSTFEYFELAYKMIESSREIDGITLLAMDALYHPESGELNEQKTDLWVTNRFLSSQVKQLNERLANAGLNKRFFLGASVSPNRKDWEAELQYVIEETDAVLVKLIPSTQHIKLADDRHRPYYEMLRSANLPLLVHVGPEYSFPEGIRERKLDNYKFIEKPLECGVTVIAAHCATPVFPIIEKNVTGEFLTFMKSANQGDKVRLWADTSALSLATRIPFLREIVKRFPAEWLVHGSDFPIPIEGWPHIPWVTYDITPAEYIKICRTENPLDRDVKIKRAHRFSDSILANAGKVLRLS